MNISEFAKPVTAKSLNESLARRYGSKINLERFTLEQLQDARNKLRTTISQIEVKENFNAVIEKESYQRSKLMLDVLNAAISERGDIAEAAKPDYIDLDGDGDTEEPMKKAAKDKKKKKVGEAKLREGAEDQAEIVMAAKDMVDRVTNWMEDTAEMQTESMLELADAIRDEMGVEQSTSFVQAVKPALEALYQSMEQAREALSGGVGMLTGEGAAPATMGAEEPLPPAEGEEALPPEEAPMEPTVDQDEFGAAGAAAGGAEPAARPQRESIDPRKLAKTLASKKK